MSEHPAYAAALEARARQIAADKMRLVKDPTGARLPDELWRQALLQAQAEPFQDRVAPWMGATFGAMISGDKEERAHRFLEEALELVQSTGTTASEAHQLVDYVFGRSVGDTHQEVGGVMVTLAALCLAHALDMHEAGETELARVWTKIEQIREKQAAKPKHSPLPEHVEGGRLWRHVKRGTLYEEIGRAELQVSVFSPDPAEHDTLVIYRGVDGRLWAREEGEFEDGRFDRIETPSKATEGENG